MIHKSKCEKKSMFLSYLNRCMEFQYVYKTRNYTAELPLFRQQNINDSLSELPSFMHKPYIILQQY